MQVPIKDIDAYLAIQTDSVREKLKTLRETIKTLVPDAEEVISYAMPAFKYHGMLVGFAAGKQHIGFYPWNGHTVDQFKEDLKDYKTSKGAIQFPQDKPIPIELVKKIVNVRIKENLSREKEKIKRVNKKS